MLKKLFALCWFAVVLMACERSTTRVENSFDSLISTQITKLSAVRRDITKTATINGKEDHLSIVADETFWLSELDVFRQLRAYENPVYRKLYEMNDRSDDPKSNLLIQSYHSKKDVPVTDLKFYYQGVFRRLKKIEGVYIEKNSLYLTKRKLIMEFEEIEGMPLLKHYSISGTQKMVLSDTVYYQINTEITL